MSEGVADSDGISLTSPSGLSLRLNANGSLQRFDCGAISLLLFLGNEVEGGPANLYLRRHPAKGDSTPIECVPLLGPRSPTSFEASASADTLTGWGSWLGIDYSISLVLAKKATAWFWHVKLENKSATAQELDLTYAQDLALAPYWGLRLNEFYVSQYVDHTPLSHVDRGLVLA